MRRSRFQFPPPCGRRHLCLGRWSFRDISIPAPTRGGDATTSPGGWRCSYFNSRPHAGGDDIVHRHSRGIHISIPAPARGATCFRHKILPNAANFNSRPRAGGDAGMPNPSGDSSISILAPARGATHALVNFERDFFISILAPARGATAKMSKSDCLILCIYAVFYFPSIGK